MSPGPGVRMRMVRGVSSGADAVFNLLGHGGGERTLVDLAKSPAVGDATAAAAELEGLGLVEPVGEDGVVRFTPAAAGAVLLVSSSRPG